jgi:lysophospholipase L1-like esterase
MITNRTTILDKRLKRRTFLGEVGSTAAMFVPSVGGGISPPDDNGERIRVLLSSPEPATWLFTGDSITHGALHTSGWRSYPELFAERVRWEMGRLRDIVINTGVSGDTTEGLLKDLDWRVFRFSPHVTSVMLGMNDGALRPGGTEYFRSNLNRLVDAIEAHVSLPLLHTPNLIYYPKGLVEYVEVIREVANKRKIAIVDHYAHWLERLDSPLSALNPGGAKNPEALLYWLNDGRVHPNQFGHRLLANHLFTKLGIYDPASRTCRLFVE